MGAFSDANPRQQEILTHLGQRMGFGVNDLTNVIYTENNIPEQVMFANSKGSYSRYAMPELGGILTDQEVTDLKYSRINGLQQSVVSRNTTNNSGPTSFNNTDDTVYSTPAYPNTTPLVDQLSSAYATSIMNPALGRLSASGLGQGAIIKRSSSEATVNRFPSTARDYRVKISDPSGRISKAGGPLSPLSQTDYKVVFPYTPEISLTHSSTYSSQSPTHSNYEYLFYQNSSVSEISIVASFSARTSADADYVLAVQHFFRSVTKMFYGQDDIAGLPPVVCRLEGHGDLQFSYVPVVITNFAITLPGDVDYISATDPNNGRVPTMQSMSISAKPLYSRSRVTNDFSLTKFSKGEMLGNPDNGSGGFI
jgi:hypothetical protein